jgi:hypothetical protein
MTLVSGPPVVIVVSGIAVTNLGAHGATPFTVVDDLGIAVTLVDSGGLPVTLLNPDGTLWSDSGEPDNRLKWDSDRIMWGSDRLLWG